LYKIKNNLSQGLHRRLRDVSDFQIHGKVMPVMASNELINVFDAETAEQVDVS
jgi:hypothetical protein